MLRIFWRFVLLVLITLIPLHVSAQLTVGTTGLLNMPSAEMQQDKTLMIGGNYLNKGITPPSWYYGTYNYFVNVTFFPWLEVSYVSTLFSAEHLGLKKKGFTNEDRFFAVKLRVLKEGQFWKYMPAVVLGTADPYTESGDGTSGNGYFNRYYLAVSKHFQIENQQIGVHLTYLKNKRKDYKLNGLAVGLTWNPSFQKNLCIIAEYDTKDFLLGATYLLFNHLHLQVEMQRMTRFSGGLAYKFYLKGGGGTKAN